MEAQKAANSFGPPMQGQPCAVSYLPVHRRSWAVKVTPAIEIPRARKKKKYRAAHSPNHTKHHPLSTQLPCNQYPQMAVDSKAY